VADLALDFTIPGYDIELKVRLYLLFTSQWSYWPLQSGGRDIAVTSNNASEYIDAVIDAILGKGAQAQAKAVREGFSKVFPISDLRTFTVDELVMLFGNSEEDWSADSKFIIVLLLLLRQWLKKSVALSEVLKADHGFTGDSRAIHHLVEIMSEYDISSRRNYLQFITGSPKLPIGGM
jgi:E3 ubiquitin-protein ligase TRIP12